LAVRRRAPIENSGFIRPAEAAPTITATIHVIRPLFAGHSARIGELVKIGDLFRIKRWVDSNLRWTPFEGQPEPRLKV
jgi:hypothetical protein